MNGITDRITAGIEAELVEAEERYASQGLRTMRLINELSIYTEGASYFVYSAGGGTRMAPAESMTTRRHPMAAVADGETVSYNHEGQQVTMTRIGVFDAIARVTMPGHRGDRITFMAERVPAAA